jgi:K+-transporting ATPase KdpF subunit
VSHRSRAALSQDGGVRVTVVEGILLAVSAAVFVYLGVAMFKPEWF